MKLRRECRKLLKLWDIATDVEILEINNGNSRKIKGIYQIFGEEREDWKFKFSHGKRMVKVYAE